MFDSVLQSRPNVGWSTDPPVTSLAHKRSKTVSGFFPSSKCLRCDEKLKLKTGDATVSNYVLCWSKRYIGTGWDSWEYTFFHLLLLFTYLRLVNSWINLKQLTSFFFHWIPWFWPVKLWTPGPQVRSPWLGCLAMWSEICQKYSKVI
jgi:hypothetical protein